MNRSRPEYFLPIGLRKEYCLRRRRKVKSHLGTSGSTSEQDPHRQEYSLMPKHDKYDRQVIVRLATGITKKNGMTTDGSEIITSAANLAEKALGERKPAALRAGHKLLPTKVVDFPAPGDPNGAAKRKALGEALGELTEMSRLYIIGHGDWKHQAVGEVGAVNWADTLFLNGLKKVGVISLVSCNAGRDLGSAADVRINNSADSFASVFHKQLGEYDIKPVLFARVYKVVVLNSAPETGRKAVEQKDQQIRRRQNSKLKFWWDGDTQKRETVVYATDADSESASDDFDFVFAPPPPDLNSPNG
jgi:hypothetical protein